MQLRKVKNNNGTDSLLYNLIKSGQVKIMLIKEFRIKNFRKLKSCNLNLTNKQTILQFQTASSNQSAFFMNE